MAADLPLFELCHVNALRGELGEQKGLVDVSLRIDQGEHVCVLGPNGSGKSTLVKLLTRELYPLYEPGAAIRMLGRERWDVSEFRAQIGIVSPDMIPPGTTETTGIDVVVSSFFSGTKIFEHHAVTASLRARGHAALARAGVAHLANRKMSEMSAGEARRTLVARALVHEPSTLLLDEPSTALDLGAQAQLRETMRDLARAGVGLVLVTHHVSEIIPEIDRVVLLRQGRIVGDGPKETMLTSERLSALFGTQVSVALRDGYFHAY